MGRSAISPTKCIISGEVRWSRTSRGTKMKHIEISVENLAHLGDGVIAYVKAIHFARAGDPTRAEVFARARGPTAAPIMVTDSREAAIANAVSQHLETVSVH